MSHFVSMNRARLPQHPGLKLSLKLFRTCVKSALYLSYYKSKSKYDFRLMLYHMYLLGQALILVVCEIY